MGKEGGGFVKGVEPPAPAGLRHGIDTGARLGQARSRKA